MKRRIALILVGIMLVATLAGCSCSTNDSQSSNNTAITNSSNATSSEGGPIINITYVEKSSGILVDGKSICTYRYPVFEIANKDNGYEKFDEELGNVFWDFQSFCEDQMKIIEEAYNSGDKSTTDASYTYDLTETVNSPEVYSFYVTQNIHANGDRQYVLGYVLNPKSGEHIDIKNYYSDKTKLVDALKDSYKKGEYASKYNDTAEKFFEQIKKEDYYFNYYIEDNTIKVIFDGVTDLNTGDNNSNVIVSIPLNSK